MKLELNEKELLVIYRLLILASQTSQSDVSKKICERLENYILGCLYLSERQKPDPTYLEQQVKPTLEGLENPQAQITDSNKGNQS